MNRTASTCLPFLPQNFARLRSVLLRPLCAVALVSLAPCLLAQEPTAPDAAGRPSPTATPAKPSAENPVPPGAPAPAAFASVPQVCIDVLMVWLPEEKALPLLPELRDPLRLEAAQKRLLEMIGRKEAHLIDWPEMVTHSGNRSVSETIVEQRYPIAFEQPVNWRMEQKPPPLSSAEKAVLSLMRLGAIVPSSFEIKNTGATVEVEPEVSADGKSVSMNLSVQSVTLERMMDFKTGKNEQGDVLTVQQPIFKTHKVQTNITLRDGRRRLLYAGKPLEPEGRMVFFIIGARVIPVGQ